MTGKDSIPAPAAKAMERDVKVWDLPVRVFHWLLALVVIIAIATQEAKGRALWIHVYSGSLLVGFVTFRVVWGLIGSRHALFSDFVRPLAAVKDYARRLFDFDPPYVVGHNPIGGWVIVSMLALTLLAAISGLMVTDDKYVGPLAHFGGGVFGEAHEGLGTALMVLVIIHILGVFAHGLVTGENLPRAMINGIKRVPSGQDEKDASPAGVIRPSIAIALGLAALWLIL